MKMMRTYCKKGLSMILALVMIVTCLAVFPMSASAASVGNSAHEILFDWQYYYNQYGDLRAAFGRNPSALRNHYNQYGKREGRSPSALFDPHFYLGVYPDLRAAYGSDYTRAYNHFVLYGIKEGRQASSHFSVEVYKSNYCDLRAAFGSNNLLYLKHYREYGIAEGRNAVSRQGGRTLKEGIYYIQSALNTNMVLDISGVSGSNGANVHIWQNVRGLNQQFRVTTDGNRYTITAMHSGKVLDVDWGRTANGTNVLQYTSTGGANQKWHLIDAGNGYYYIRTMTNRYLDVSGANTANGTNVHIWEGNGTNAQKWRFVEVSQYSNDNWQKPMNNYRTTQTFGHYSKTMAANRNRPYHCGIDIVSDDLTVKAAANGVVVYRGYSSGNGNHIILQHTVNGTTVKTLYSHLSNFNGCPQPGQSVRAGDAIGTMGNTGNSYGAHLHFAIFSNNGGNDPVGYTSNYGAQKAVHGGVTFYNPAYVLQHGQLPS